MYRKRISAKPIFVIDSEQNEKGFTKMCGFSFDSIFFSFMCKRFQVEDIF